jgi:hypothetical protein
MLSRYRKISSLQRLSVDATAAAAADGPVAGRDLETTEGITNI